jgi:S1-C subfamily serine protease
MPGSPAEKAGLRGSDKQVSIDEQTANVGGDVITAIDDQPVAGIDDLIAYLVRSTQVAQKVTLTILRDGKEEKLDVTLAARPTAQERATENSSSPSPASGIRLGILGVNMASAIAQEMNLPEDQQGVLIQQVEPGSLADQAGLQAGSETVTIDGQEILVGGDVITILNGQQVPTIQDLKTALSQLPVDHPLTLTILRDGEETEIEIQPGS